MGHGCPTLEQEGPAPGPTHPAHLVSENSRLVRLRTRLRLVL